MAPTPELGRASCRLGLTLTMLAGLGLFAVHESATPNKTVTRVAIGSIAMPSYGQIMEAQHKAQQEAVAATTTTTSTTSTTLAPKTPAEIAASEVTPEELAAWSKVNLCEEGGYWHVNGSKYAGGLGISRTNWAIYGGQRDFGDEATATKQEQIIVGERIEPNPPDQDGCGGGW